MPGKKALLHKEDLEGEIQEEERKINCDWNLKLNSLQLHIMTAFFKYRKCGT